MTATARRGGTAGATAFAACGIAVLIGLGVWQLERKAWKESLIAKVSERLDAPPQALPPREQWAQLDAAKDEFRRTIFLAEFIPGKTALVYTPGSSFRPDVSGAGYWVLSPARVSGGGVIVVNRGFVPLDRKDAALATPTAMQITGAMRWPEARTLFTPADDPAHGVWYTRDPQIIASAGNWGEVAPFYIEQESPQASGGFPRAGKLTVALPNNHLQYALTWFGLAAGLVGVYSVWLFARLRRS